MTRIIYHLRLVLTIKGDSGRMPAITIIPPTHTATRTRASESGGAWFVEWITKNTPPEAAEDHRNLLEARKILSTVIHMDNARHTWKHATKQYIRL